MDGPAGQDTPLPPPYNFLLLTALYWPLVSGRLPLAAYFAYCAYYAYHAYYAHYASYAYYRPLAIVSALCGPRLATLYWPPTGPQASLESGAGVLRCFHGLALAGHLPLPVISV